MTDSAPTLTDLCACGNPRSEHDAGIAACGMCPCEEFRTAPAPAENDAAALHHLRDHLTDGAWHDRCQFCLNRRVYGGTGVWV